MSENYVNPTDHGPVSAAGVTLAEGTRGAVTGGLSGLIKGPIYGLLAGAAALALPAALVIGIPTALVGGGALAFGASLAGVATTAAWVVGVPTALAATIGGVTGLFGGAVAGGPLGALFGGLRGMGRGRDIVEHERGAAHILETQQAMAQNQAATVAALQAQAARPVIIQAAPAPVVAPGFTVTAAAHQGQGLERATVANDVAATHAQKVEAGRAAQAVSETARA